MKKFLLLTIIFTTYCFTIPYAKAYEINQYYECPSKAQYTPSETLESFCKEVDKIYKSFGTNASCKDLYKDEFKNAEKEFYSGKCKLSKYSVMQDSYNGAKCGITFTTNPTPQIIATTSMSTYSKQNGDESSLQCLENLHNEIRNIYPNIK